MDLALNNRQWLICHKTKPNQTKPMLNTNNFHTVSWFQVLLCNTKHFQINLFPP